MRPFETRPASRAPAQIPSRYLPLTEQQERRRELANAEAALAELVSALDAARAGIGAANRTHTAPVMSGDRIIMPALRYSPERMKERKSAAFRLFNQRRGQVSAARRRVEAARAALVMPTLAFVERRAATKAELCESKRAHFAPNVGRQ